MAPIQSRKIEPAALGKAALLFLLVAGILTVADEISLHVPVHGWERLVDDLLGRHQPVLFKIGLANQKDMTDEEYQNHAAQGGQYPKLNSIHGVGGN